MTFDPDVNFFMKPKAFLSEALGFNPHSFFFLSMNNHCLSMGLCFFSNHGIMNTSTHEVSHADTLSALTRTLPS
jgi:hypothetical protein